MKKGVADYLDDDKYESASVWVGNTPAMGNYTVIRNDQLVSLGAEPSRIMRSYHQVRLGNTALSLVDTLLQRSNAKAYRDAHTEDESELDRTLAQAGLRMIATGSKSKVAQAALRAMR